MTLTAVLLAGGESRRMGKDKAILLFNGEPLWQRQLRVLRLLKPEKIFVSTQTECVWLPADVELLLDEPPSRGPVSGLAAALTRMRTSHLIALAIDMPFVTATQLQELFDRATPGCGVVPIVGDLAEPLAAIYPREVVVDLAQALAGSDWSLQPLVRRLAVSGKIQFVHPSDASIYRSLNKPSDC